MIDANAVYSRLASYHDTRDFPQEDILDCAQSGFNYVSSRLKAGVSNDALFLEAAAAVAHYYFFIRTLNNPEKYESYKVGDITVTNDPQKALEREKEMRDRALAEASSILIDGGFFCCGY